MTNTKLEQLTKAIQSAVSSIIRLEFGCKFRLVNEHWKKKDNYICIVVGKNNWAGLGNEECTNDIDTLEYGKFEGFGDYVDEILGRDITLEDCLIAWDEKLKAFCGYGLKGAGMNEKIKNVILNWKYNIPLHQQKQETIDFLWDLICK